MMTKLDATQLGTAVAIPRAFAYQAMIKSDFGRRMRGRLERVAGTTLEFDEAKVTEFGKAMNSGDRLGDAYIDAAFATPQGKTRAREDVEQALAGGIDSVTDSAPELLALFEQIDTEPEWLDWNTVEHGAEVFRRYGPELYPYFGMSTFAAYAMRSINRPLALTGAYTGNSAFHRFLETSRFWTDTTEPNALRPGGVGRRSAVMVRTLHSIIRHTILPHPEWNRAELGVPISQLGMFITLMASSQYPGQQLKVLGYRPSDDDVVALMHLWRYVGHLMGAESPWYPQTVGEGFRAQLMTILSERLDVGPDSQQLCTSFMDTYRPATDARGLAKVAGAARYQFQLGHARFYLGPELHKASGLSDPGLWRYAPLVRFVPNFARETARRSIVGAAGWIDQVHRKQRQDYLTRHLDGGRAKFQPVDKLAH